MQSKWNVVVSEQCDKMKTQFSKAEKLQKKLVLVSKSIPIGNLMESLQMIVSKYSPQVNKVSIMLSRIVTKTT